MKKALLALSLLMSSSAFANGTWYYYFVGTYGVPGAFGYAYAPMMPRGYWLLPNYNGWSFYSYYNYLPRYSSFATISYSASTDSFAGSWGQPSFAAAVSTAQTYCGKSDCQPVVWVQGGCAVATTSKSTQKLTWGVATDRYTAFQNSLNACTTADGRRAPDCVERAWVCSF